MTRTRIEGVVNADGSQGYALNHFVGCEGGCPCWYIPYCWARKCLARANFSSSSCILCRRFTPHYHPERLGDFKKLKGANTVAVGWMGDIWAYSGLTDPLWLDMMHPLIVASHMGRNTLLFLTQNPRGYLDAEKAYCFGPEAWLGVTVTSQADVDRIGPDFAAVDHPNKFVSYEPMLGEITDWGKMGRFGWLYMGALTDGRGRNVPLKIENCKFEILKWTTQGLIAARERGAKVWCKKSLGEGWAKETPWLGGKNDRDSNG